MTAYEAYLVERAAKDLHHVRDALTGARLDPADDVYVLSGELAELVSALRGVVDQLATAAAGMGTRPGLRVDDLGAPESAERLAERGSTALGRACACLATAAADVNGARSALGRLYVEAGR